jgi:hypothetical protein
MDTKPNAPANLTHALPKDEKSLAAIGRIALVHSQLDNQFRMTVKDLVGVTQEEALDATARQGSGELRKRIWKLGRTRLGDGPALVRLQALLQRASRATEGRNQLLHSVWGRDPDGRGDYLRGEDHRFQLAPTAKELEETLIELMAVLADFVEGRLRGFLDEALKAKPQKSSPNPRTISRLDEQFDA